MYARDQSLDIASTDTSSRAETAPLDDDSSRAETVEDGPDVPHFSTTLALSAEEAYELFCDVEAIPDWMSIVRSARALNRCDAGRGVRVAFIANLEQASIGYTLNYEYDDANMSVKWATNDSASTRIAGTARFQALGPNACMLHYELELRIKSNLPQWRDPMYNGHPASAAISDFRDYVSGHKDTE